MSEEATKDVEMSEAGCNASSHAAQESFTAERNATIAATARQETTFTGNNEQVQKQSPPVAYHATINAAGSKELRVQQEEEQVAQAIVAHPQDDDDDENAVMAAVVVDDDEENEEVAVVAQVTSTSTTPATTTKKKSSKAKRPAKKSIVAQDRMLAAADARRLLKETVPRLPVMVNETHVVRSFGRIQVENLLNGQDDQYSSASSLYPVGFSCDRYEFSPTHGRVLKMRCTIFDGKMVAESCSTILKTNGPVFRIMWGLGVDQDVDIVDYPYDIYSSSSPITNDARVDAIAVPLANGKELFENLEPEPGMRVRVRFDHDMWYSGTIVSVGEGAEYDHKKGQVLYDVRIRYDDGSSEETKFPDPDISIYLPGEK